MSDTSGTVASGDDILNAWNDIRQQAQPGQSGDEVFNNLYGPQTGNLPLTQMRDLKSQMDFLAVPPKVRLYMMQHPSQGEGEPADVPSAGGAKHPWDMQAGAGVEGPGVPVPLLDQLRGRVIPPELEMRMQGGGGLINPVGVQQTPLGALDTGLVRVGAQGGKNPLVEPDSGFAPHKDYRSFVPAQNVYDALVAKGFAPNAARGITGNLMWESGGGAKGGIYLDPPTDAGHYNWGTGDAAEGAAQWEGARQKGLAPTLQSQVSKIWDEFNNPGKAGMEKGIFERLQRAQSPEEAADIVNIAYERPQKPGASAAQRRQFASMKYGSDVAYSQPNQGGGFQGGRRPSLFGPPLPEKGGGGGGQPVNVVINSPAAPQRGMDAKDLMAMEMKMQLLQGMFPQHTLTPVSYNPFQYVPQERHRVDVNEGVG